MKLQEVMAGEYDAIEGTAFWQKFIGEIIAYRKIKSRECETFPADKLTKVQGELVAIDRIMRLPKDILSSPSEGLKE